MGKLVYTCCYISFPLFKNGSQIKWKFYIVKPTFKKIDSKTHKQITFGHTIGSQFKKQSSNNAISKQLILLFKCSTRMSHNLGRQRPSNCCGWTCKSLQCDHDSGNKRSSHTTRGHKECLVHSILPRVGSVYNRRRCCKRSQCWLVTAHLKY